MTATVPKAMLPVAGRPFADHQLRWLADGGVTEVVYCVAHLGDQIRAHVGDGRNAGLHVRYSDEGPDLMGTGGALALARRAGLLPERFLVVYGDSYLTCRPRDVYDDAVERDCDALMCVYRNDDRFDTSNVRYADGMVQEYRKGASQAAGFSYIDYGLGVLTAEVVDALPPDRPSDLADVYRRLSLAGRLAGYPVTTRFYEIGSPAGLAELEAHLS